MSFLPSAYEFKSSPYTEQACKFNLRVFADLFLQDLIYPLPAFETRHSVAVVSGILSLPPGEFGARTDVTSKLL